MIFVGMVVGYIILVRKCPNINDILEYNLPYQQSNFTCNPGGSTGLVVMGGDSSPEGRGFGYQCHILDGHFST